MIINIDIDKYSNMSLYPKALHAERWEYDMGYITTEEYINTLYLTINDAIKTCIDIEKDWRRSLDQVEELRKETERQDTLLDQQDREIDELNNQIESLEYELLEARE